MHSSYRASREVLEFKFLFSFINYCSCIVSCYENLCSTHQMYWDDKFNQWQFTLDLVVPICFFNGFEDKKIALCEPENSFSRLISCSYNVVMLPALLTVISCAIMCFGFFSFSSFFLNRTSECSFQVGPIMILDEPFTVSFWITLILLAFCEPFLPSMIVKKQHFNFSFLLNRLTAD